ncbi:uncharacterized protein LOC119077784 [Bradysia coprophila]|uniref:uncharacterized protein LOC119077784 n=1 Tax=Bradysia coprophila TaxID=38358 RepID=UPI00187D8205|nr:uncharacterized protein LOC119077784 [Bradysia coprophila]
MWRLTIVLAICIHCVFSDLQITPIAGPQVNLPDSVFWSDYDQSLYYADYFAFGNESSIYRYDYNKGTIHSAYVDGKDEMLYLLPVKRCGDILQSILESILYKNNLFMAGFGHDNYLIHWDGYQPIAKVIRSAFSVEENSPSAKMDISKPNAKGEFFGGTTTDQYCGGTSNSSVYSYSIAKGLRKIYTGSQANSGMVFNGDTIYVTDVCLQTITELKKDRVGNYVSRVVFDFRTEDNATRPSGLEIDADGYLYVVGYVNGKVWRIDPKTSTGVVIATFPYFLTGVAFGGPKRDILFVVTASALIQAWPLKALYYNPAPPLIMITGLETRGVRSEDLQC